MKSIVSFFTKYSTRRTAAFLAVAFVLINIGLLIPSHYVQAANLFTDPIGTIGDALKGAIVQFFFGYLTSLLLAILTTVLVIISTILTVFAIITGAVMDAVINFSLAVPYTPANPAAAGTVITIAWSVMRDLANIGLVFVLIAIAISTILELGTERWRKLLIPFIGIALLINFTPVITGFIIDITNILTKIFFDAGGAGGGWKLFLPAFSTLGSIWKDSIGSIFSGDISTAFGTFAQAVVDVFFHILSIAAFISMSLLILARILALWILVIISPIAFVAYILPETNRYFKQWWSNFFQWAILPIPLGIFYWLAARFVASGEDLCTNFSFTNPTNIGGSYAEITKNTVATATTSASGLTILQNAHMCEAIMLMFAIGTLFIGFMISFSFSAVGSKLVVSTGTKYGTAAGTWLGKKTGRASISVGRAGGRAAATRIAGTQFGQKAAALGRRAVAIDQRLGQSLGNKVPLLRTGVQKVESIAKRKAKDAAKIANPYAKQAIKGAIPFAQKQLTKLGPAGAAMGAGLAKGVEPSKTNNIPQPGRFDPDKTSADEIKANAADWVWNIKESHLRKIRDNYNQDVMDAIVDELIKIYNNPAALMKFNQTNRKFAQFTATFQAQQVDPRIPDMSLPPARGGAAPGGPAGGTPGGGGAGLAGGGAGGPGAGGGAPGGGPTGGAPPPPGYTTSPSGFVYPQTPTQPRGARQAGTIVPPWQQPPPTGGAPAPATPPTPPNPPRPQAPTPATAASTNPQDMGNLHRAGSASAPASEAENSSTISQPQTTGSNPSVATPSSGNPANFVTKKEAAKKEEERIQREQYKAELEEQQNRLRAKVEQTEATYNLNETPENLELYRKAVNDAIQNESSPARRAAYIKILQGIYNKRGT